MHHSLYFNTLQGQQYFVQVSAYNMKGWGPAQTTTPACASPSSRWWLLTLSSLARLQLQFHAQDAIAIPPSHCLGLTRPPQSSIQLCTE